MAKWNMKTIHIHQTSSNYFDPHHITGRFQDAFSFLAAFFSMHDSIDDSLADITLIFSLNSRRLVLWCNSPKVANNYRESISGNLRGCWTFFWQNMTKVSKIGPSNHPTIQPTNHPTNQPIPTPGCLTGTISTGPPSFLVDIVRCQPMPQLAPPPAAPTNVRIFLRCALTGRVALKVAEDRGWFFSNFLWYHS